MKYYLKVILSVIIAVVLELTVFNYPVWLARFNTGAPHAIRYSLEDMAADGWDVREDGYHGSSGARLTMPTDGMRAYKVIVSCAADPDVGPINLEYTSADGTAASVSGIRHGSKALFPLNKTVGPGLSLVFPGAQDSVLTAVQVTVNPIAPDISIARIVAVVLIYVCGSLLFRIQRMPDYTEYITKKE